jgi:hypothetical protein
MSKYQPLWESVGERTEPTFRLSFEAIREILGFEIDHSFLNAKKELLSRGYQVGKISLKNKTVDFVRVDAT